MDQIKKLKDLINKANDIVVMTGAGISVPSGIPDFRSSNGLYNNKDNDMTDISPETILSYSFFKEYPDKFYTFYRNKMICLDALPNIAHKTLAELESMGKVKAIITQNIDGLHQLAGSKKVIELHGSIHRNYCTKCQKSYSLSKILQAKGIPTCDCGGIIKPDVVLYEEALSSSVLDNSLIEIEKADLLIVVGTSLLVNPAASLIHYFRGSNLVIISKGITPYDNYAKLVIHKPLETILTPELL
ncbi:NAD-dependent protein deacylase [Mycoplasmatota bacterium]|nr:NAD-dependent protein deacylase [Mycoplasmatota bacterium]